MADRRRRRELYAWSATCPCGARVSVETDTDAGLRNIAAVWRDQHDGCAPTTGPLPPRGGSGGSPSPDGRV